MRIFLIPFAWLSVFTVSPTYALCLFNCAPDEARVCSEAKTRTKNLIAPGLRGQESQPAQVVSCRKVNGQELNIMGVTAYRMMLEVTLVYPKGYRGIGLTVPPGGTDTRQIEVNFQKTEQGWMDGAGILY
jgi:hypothetical protein